MDQTILENKKYECECCFDTRLMATCLTENGIMVCLSCEEKE
jgi:hypothetical protein